MADNLILCVGNSMMGDDGAGPLLAEKLCGHPIPGWRVIDGGSSPESYAHQIRDLRPDKLLIVDATEMGLEPGEMRIIDERDIAELFIVTTHNLPLSYLIAQLREDVADITFIGIQPAIVAFYAPMMQPVKEAVEALYQRLHHWQEDGGIPRLAVPDDEVMR
ncbi:hydrogenase maturation peptidase HycI [Edwardsiella tarda]|uniref:Hydrogenase maturation peptidase HycI n=1 Tax=Edwardsiella tarda ATCC 15947 = NBRC 105688 TaxID=667121 RepID=A0AC61TJK1_EDWTA|nr:hydrogenase maturation peptidase HycI [Edwardsiella tarda]UAL56195.1 hydrogenase maturation peptidase HycI [Edwardsiella tarda]UCQ00747.1 hydrogenase maturation peptidase HycI [Edwardsiella tarda ATCC 15947 = NBRC 105688]BEH71385.1 hydrogenase maturation peptidase HycI [Edwardsiella tarda]